MAAKGTQLKTNWLLREINTKNDQDNVQGQTAVF